MSLAAPPNSPTAAAKRVPLGYLEPGHRLAAPINDTDGETLIVAGAVIDREMLARLSERGVLWVSIAGRDYEALEQLKRHGPAPAAADPAKLAPRTAAARGRHTPATRELDEAMGAGGMSAITPADDPFASRVARHGATAYDTHLKNANRQQHQQSVLQVGDLMARLDRAEAVSGEQLSTMSHESVVQAAEDMDLFVSMGISSSDRETVFEHSASVSRLAIAMGVRLGLDEGQLSELGAGCLVHDAGMLRVNPALRDAPRRLTPSEFVDIARHPIVGADLLYTNMDRVPVGVRMVVYQTHERCDGSGYPRGCKQENIHALAKIAAVADTYVAKISSRPHRPAITPYRAIKGLLEDGARGLFDAAAVRALLEAVALFPIGSLVQLDDGRVGRVLRSNGEDYTNPVVETWRLVAGPQEPEVVDLAAGHHTVRRALQRLQDAVVE